MEKERRNQKRERERERLGTTERWFVTRFIRQSNSAINFCLLLSVTFNCVLSHFTKARKTFRQSKGRNFAAVAAAAVAAACYWPFALVLSDSRRVVARFIAWEIIDDLMHPKRKPICGFSDEFNRGLRVIVNLIFALCSREMTASSRVFQ